MIEEKHIVPDEEVMSKIFVLRGQKVMLDRDLAKIYGIKGFRLREQVKRNEDRFPKIFMFRLTEKEVDFMVSHFAIPSRKVLGGSLPYAFSEHGILMLANVLRSKRAIQMSIKIIEMFVKMREMLFAHQDLILKIEKIERNLEGQSHEIKVLFTYLKKLMSIKPSKQNPSKRNKIGF